MSEPQQMDAQTRDFMTAFSKLIEHVNVLVGSDGDGDRLFDRLAAYLGQNVSALPVVAEQLPVHRVADADGALLLTTNRVDDLEIALSQRPGRVDLAVEIPLPDEAGRLALLRLYGRDLFGDAALSDAAARSAGTTASLAKELVRRAVLGAAVARQNLADEHLGTALDDLLSDAEHLTRRLLGVDTGDGASSDLPPGVGPGPLRPSPRVRRSGGSGSGWFAYSPMAD